MDGGRVEVFEWVGEEAFGVAYLHSGVVWLVAGKRGFLYFTC